MRPGNHLLVTVELARTKATVSAEIVRSVDGGAEGLVLFELMTGPSDAFDKVLH